MTEVFRGSELNALGGRAPDREIDRVNEALQAQQFERVVDLAKTLIASYPATPVLHNFLGMSLIKLGRPTEAVEAYRGALAIEPNYAEVLQNLAWVLRGLDRKEEALAVCRKLLTLPLDDNDTRLLIRSLGELGRLGDPEFAQLEIDRAGRRVAYASAAALADATAGAMILPALDLPGGTPRLDFSAMRQTPTKPLEGLGAVCLRVRDWEFLQPYLVLTGSTLIDDGNGVGCIELVGHYWAYDVLRAVSKEGAGALRLSIAESGPRVEIGEPVGIIRAVPNYSSWLLGELPRASLYRTYAPGTKLLLCGDVQPFHLDSLALFGFAREDIVLLPGGSNAFGKELIFATPTHLHHNCCYQALGDVRDHVLAQVKQEVVFGRSIYLSRSKLGATDFRGLRNEHDVEHFLAARGFEILHPQEMSFAEQVMAFAGAKRIVAPFGAALASSVFCDPRVQTCVIRTKNTPEFDRIYQWLGLGLSFVAVSDAEADIEGLERFLTVAVKSDAG